MHDDDRLPLLRRVRWGNLARVLGVLAAIALVAAWPRLGAREPALPPATIAPAAPALGPPAAASSDAAEPRPRPERGHGALRRRPVQSATSRHPDRRSRRRGGQRSRPDRRSRQRRSAPPRRHHPPAVVAVPRAIPDPPSPTTPPPAPTSPPYHAPVPRPASASPPDLVFG